MKKYLLFFQILILCSSCESFFESVVEIDPPPHETQLVIHSYVQNGDSSMLVIIEKSYPALEADYGNDFVVTGASVKVLRDDVVWFDGVVNDYLFDLPEPIAMGHQYVIEVSHPDFGTTRSTPQSVSHVTTVTQAEFEFEGTINEEGDRVNAVRATINDDPDVENFYEISLLAIDDFSGDKYPVNLNIIDPNVSYGANGSLLFRDNNFNGTAYRFLFYTYDFSETENFVLKINNLTEDQYLYSKSLDDYYQFKDFELLSEPVSIYSNFENGLGIFGISNPQYEELEYK